MIKFERISGKALVLDGFTNVIPTSGMSFPGSSVHKTYVIMNGPAGRMELTINNKYLWLPSNSIMKVKGGKSPEKAKMKGGWEQVRLFLGQYWARVTGDEPFEKVVANVAVGLKD